MLFFAQKDQLNFFGAVPSENKDSSNVATVKLDGVRFVNGEILGRPLPAVFAKVLLAKAGFVPIM